MAGLPQADADAKTEKSVNQSGSSSSSRRQTSTGSDAGQSRHNRISRLCGHHLARQFLSRRSSPESAVRDSTCRPPLLIWSVDPTPSNVNAQHILHEHEPAVTVQDTRSPPATNPARRRRQECRRDPVSSSNLIGSLTTSCESSCHWAELLGLAAVRTC